MLCYYYSMSAALTQLVEIGLSRLEAEVYAFLLANRPTTAYGIGKRIGKPTANVYKAVESLARRGAVLTEEGDNRLCRAVPASEFLDRIDREFRERTKAAGQALAKLGHQTEDERVYRIESAPQLLERCRQMIERCKSHAVIDAFPQTLQAILPSIRGAVKRRVAVYVEAYKPIRIPGAQVAITDLGQQVLGQWRSQQLNVIVDGRECLTALLDTGLTEVHQGLWTNSLYLSCLMHSGRLAEHTLVRMRDAAAADPTGKSLIPILEKHPFLLHSKLPGHREMLARYTRKSK